MALHGNAKAPGSNAQRCGGTVRHGNALALLSRAKQRRAKDLLWTAQQRHRRGVRIWAAAMRGTAELSEGGAQYRRAEYRVE